MLVLARMLIAISLRHVINERQHISSTSEQVGIRIHACANGAGSTSPENRAFGVFRNQRSASNGSSPAANGHLRVGCFTIGHDRK